jgi:hypothetical protein
MIRIPAGKSNCSELQYPCCGSEYLHHGKVETYDRAEDAERVLMTAISGWETKISYVPNRDAANPSSRRHGLRIWFCCEGCDASLQLCLAQQKGQSLVWWET